MKMLHVAANDDCYNQLTKNYTKCEAIKYVLLAFVFQLITVWFAYQCEKFCGNENENKWHKSRLFSLLTVVASYTPTM